jgi:hypothetical protein
MAEEVYYEGDNITFRGAFVINNIEQHPDANSAKVRIMERNRTIPYLSEISAIISGTQLLYKLSNLRKGVFRLFFTAAYNSGADKRTGKIEFVVRKKVGS